jgi:Tol biopolymer transport system component
VTEFGAGLFPGFAWSRNGKWLVSSGRPERLDQPNRIIAISAETGKHHAVSFGNTGNTYDELSPALSPNSQLLAFSRAFGANNWEIFVAPVNTAMQPIGFPHRLNTPQGPNRQAAWTSDDKELIVANGGSVTTGLWRIPVAGDTPARPFSILAGKAYQPAAAPSGNRLAYAHDFNNGNIWSVHVRPDGKTGVPVQTIVSARSSWVWPNAFSSDGRKVAFESNRSGPRELWTANADGSDPTFLIGNAEFATGSPTWSPDGRWIAFDARKDRKVDIYAVSTDGGTLQHVTHGATDNLVPCWSHDGNWIYFDSDRTGRFEVFKVSPHGGEEIQVTYNGGWAPQESTDGKYLFYTRTRGVDTPLLKMPLAGGAEETILPSVRERRWAVTRQGVWLLKSAGTERDQDLWLMESAGSEDGRFQFLKFSTDSISTASAVLKNPAAGIALSPDEATLMFNQVDHRATEIVLVDNFR